MEIAKAKNIQRNFSCVINAFDVFKNRLWKIYYVFCCCCLWWLWSAHLEKENIFHHIFLASPPTAGCRRHPSTFAPSTTIENNKRREAQQPRQGSSPRRSIITQHTQNVQRGALNVYEIEVDIAYQVIIIFSLLKMMSGEEARLNERETSGDAK